MENRENNQKKKTKCNSSKTLSFTGRCAQHVTQDAQETYPPYRIRATISQSKTQSWHVGTPLSPPENLLSSTLAVGSSLFRGIR